MNIADLTYLLNKPEATNEKQTIALENVVLQFPYFQAARALHLKGLYNQESFRYNYELKKTAAHTTDRTTMQALPEWRRSRPRAAATAARR